jgi:hypothetical protein
VGPAGIIIQPVELFVLTPEITGPKSPSLFVILLIWNCDIMVFILGLH